MKLLRDQRIIGDDLDFAAAIIITGKLGMGCLDLWIVPQRPLHTSDPSI